MLYTTIYLQLFISLYHRGSELSHTAHITHARAKRLKTEKCGIVPAQARKIQQCINLLTHSRPALSAVSQIVKTAAPQGYKKIGAPLHAEYFLKLCWGIAQLIPFSIIARCEHCRFHCLHIPPYAWLFCCISCHCCRSTIVFALLRPTGICASSPSSSRTA